VLPAVAASERPTLPDYELLRLIGRGSYGDVWLARGVTGAYRAVKIVWRARFPDAQPYEREFKGLTEFAAISLEESRQLALLHVSRTPDFFYYVMELADDRTRGREIDPATYAPRTLKDSVAHGAALPAADVLRLAVDLTQALAGLHARGLVHRDIKPSNIIFVSGVPKLADIGLVATASAALTFVGTEGYVPPEGPGAPAADVYSLGKVLYELATGLERTDYPRLPADLHARPDRKELLELNEIILRACAPHPENRYRDAATLLDELRLLQAGKSVRRLRTAERRLSGALRLAGALAVVAAVAGTGAWLENRRASAAEVERDALRRRTHHFAQISQARSALEEGDFQGARRLLAAASPRHGEIDLRGIEWHLLSRQARGDDSLVLRDGGPAILSVHASPDRSIYAVHDSSDLITLYDATSHTALMRIPQAPSCVGFSSDGAWLLGTRTFPIGQAQRWSVSTGESDITAPASPRFRPLGPRGEDEIIGYSEARRSPEDGHVEPGAVIVWNFSRGEVTSRIALGDKPSGRGWEFFRSAADRHKDHLALALMSGRQHEGVFRLVVLELSQGQRLHDAILDGFLPSFMRWSETSSTPRLSISDDAQAQQAIFAADTRTWHVERTTAAPGARRYDWAGVDLQAYTLGNEIALKPNAPDGPVQIKRGHGGPLNHAVWVDRDALVTSTNTGELRVWRLRDQTREGLKSALIWNSRGATTSAVFDTRTDLLFVPAADGTVAALDRASLEPRLHLPELQRPAAISHELLWGIATGGKHLAAWDPRRGIVRRTNPGAAVITHVVYAPGRDTLFYLTAAGELHRLDTAIDRPSELVQTGVVNAWALEVDSAATTLWFADNRQRVHCMDSTTGKMRWSVTLPSLASSLRLAAKLDELVIALENGEVHLRDAATGALRKSIAAGKSPLQTISLTREPARILGADRQGTVHVINPEFGATVAKIPAIEGEPAQFSTVSPDGAALALISKSGRLQVLPLR
jgi:hypothetical protein